MRSYAIKNLMKTKYQTDLLIALGVNAADYEDQTQTWKAALEVVTTLTDNISQHVFAQLEASDVETYDPYKEV